MDRTEKIAKIVGEEFEKGTALPEVRRILAKRLGGSPSLYLGTADPVYYRLAGLASPLSLAKGTKATLADGTPSAALRRAVRVRRDSGVRWETLAASTEALLGRKVGKAEVVALYENAGGDLAASYVGRGTRVGAPKTYANLGAAAEEAAKTAPARKPKAKAKPKR